MPGPRRRALLLLVAVAPHAWPGLAWSAESPQAPEFRSFAPEEQGQPIDLFTGDFRYTLPLLVVPGPRGDFPLALAYQAGITPDQEASWVGLGWTLNVGSISRQLRGLPDDFAGDVECASLASGDCVATIEDIEPNWTFSLGTEAAVELFGADSSVGLGLSAGFRGYYNSYRGIGYARTIGISGQEKAGGISAAVGLNLSLDSNTGFRAAPSLSLFDALNVNASLDAVTGLSALSVGAQYRNHLILDADLSSFLGYARPTVIPGPGRDMSGWNIAVSVKGGGEIQGVYLNLKLAGSYNVEQVKEPGERFSRGVGYLHLDRAFTEPESVRDRLLLDFNREHDGPIYDDSPHLAVPVVTHDLYALSGPGLAGTFRAYRNDVPWVYDPLQTTELLGGAVGFDVGGGLVAKFGVSGSLNGTKGSVGGWDGGDDAALLDALKGVAPAPAAAPAGWERHYFKIVGETVERAPAAALPGADAPVRAPLKPTPFDLAELPPDYFAAEAQLTRDGTDRIPLTLDATARASRTTLIEPFTNAQLDDQAAAFPEFRQARTDLYPGRRPSHVGGFRVTAANGTRYVYAIPVYDIEHEEHEFSVARSGFASGARCALVTPPTASGGYEHRIAGTEQYRHVKKLSPYAVSYLLTAVLGPDYVDADSTPGPSDGDPGHWVRFDYQKLPDPLIWRRPLYGARFVRGNDNGPYVVGKQRLGDKGVFSYGKREEWYLKEIHTASHVARVRLAERADAHGAKARTTNAPLDVGRATWRLDRIELLAKDQTRPPSAWSPVQTAHLGFDTSLQAGAPGAATPGVGRLTLKKVWTTFGAEGRGARSPWVFDYGAADPVKNPPHAWSASDRWDSYQLGTTTVTTSDCAQAGGAVDPTLTVATRYTTQDRAARDRDAPAWSLRSIVEPSGRKIEVEYESDDYAYVQDKPATVMAPLVAVGDPGGNARDLIDRRSHDEPPAPESLRIHFAVPPGTPAASVLPTYVGPTGRIYFRIRVALKDGVSDPAAGTWQTIGGYANVTAGGTVAAPGGGTLGWLELERVQGFHPFSVAAWQHLRLAQPDLISESAVNGDPNADPFGEALKVLTMVDFLEEIVALARGIYPTWFDRGWGQRLDLEHSWVRLRAAGGAKLGGGARVRRITYDDRWAAVTADAEPSLVTGFVFDYRLPDGTSSGVASYEPPDGGEENAVRDARPFTQRVLLASSYNLYSESPVAESYYPSPSVGYSRVTVRTLASERARERGGQGQPPTAASSAGPVVHEFYTARDFPVVASETALHKVRNPQPWLIPIPFLGQISLSSLAASQGYAIALNDMHGKSRRETHYEYGTAWDPARGDFQVRGQPTSSVEFVYRATGGAGGTPSTLVPTLPVLQADAVRAAADPPFAREAELVIDTRRNRTESWEVGLNVNVDLTYAVFPIPIVVPVPNMSYSLTEAKTVVTAKVIHQAGLLDRIVTTQGPARTVEQRLLFDAADGRPLLSSRTNDFGDPVFDYLLPAHWYYPRLGLAYRSAGLEVPLTGAQLVDTRQLRLPAPALPACSDAPGPRAAPCLPLGSAFAVGSGASARRLRLEASDASGLLFRASGELTTVPAGPARLVASGDANRLDLEAGRIGALSDPTTGRTDETCRWTTQDACGICYASTLVAEPSCAARAAVAGIAVLAGERGKVPACGEGEEDFGKLRLEKGAGGKQRARAVGPGGRTCRILLLDGAGNEVDPRDVRKPAEPRAVATAPAPSAGALAYAGVAFEAQVGGKPVTVFVYSDCDGWVTERKVTVPSVSYCTTPHEAHRKRIANVLSARATVFREAWPSVGEDVWFSGTPAQIAAAKGRYAAEDAFSRGIAGIWRPWREYLYVEDRSQSPDLDLRRDGTFTLRAFDWDDHENVRCAPQWRWKSQVTRYGASGNEREEVSPAAVYSAALYGFARKVPLAVARNAREREILSEAFESHRAGTGSVATEETGEGHFTFRTVRTPSTGPQLPCEPDVIAQGRLEGDVIVLEGEDLPLGGQPPRWRDGLERWIGERELSGLFADVPGEPCPIAVAQIDVDPEGRIVLALDRAQRPCRARRLVATGGGRLERGAGTRGEGIRLFVECRVQRPPRTIARIDVSTARAHTGAKSLAVERHVDFDQPTLALEPGRRYVVGGWVSRDQDDVPTFRGVETLGIQVKFWGAAGAELAAARPALARPDGPVIAGWQRIEGTFTVAAGTRWISIALQNGADRGAPRAYFDDLRIVPEDADLEAIVYDPGSLRTVARLDANNYATLYGYHADGTLAQTQQETAQGRLTIVEERHHPEERP
jgi:hypothetical protein